MRWIRSSGVSLQKQALSLSAELAKQARVALEDSRTMLALHHLCLQNVGPAPFSLCTQTPLYSSSRCVHLISRTKSDDCIPEAKETEKGGGFKVYLGKAADSHHGGRHRDARVSEDLANGKNQKNSGSYEAPILGSVCQMSPVGLRI